MPKTNTPDDLQKAAQRGEPSYVWRAGQERRLAMIKEYGADRVRGKLLVNGCGVGEYLARLTQDAELAVGLDIEISGGIVSPESSNLATKLSVIPPINMSSKAFFVGKSLLYVVPAM